MQNQRRRVDNTARPRGFTLIELLVVVGLIALLLAILLPSLQLARSHAQAVVCLSHLRQWGTTFALYTQENEGRLPVGIAQGVWLVRGVRQGDSNEPRVGRSIHTEGIACALWPQGSMSRRGAPGWLVVVTRLLR